MKKAYDLFSLDAGNAQIKAMSDDGESVFPHALHQISGAQYDALRMRGELNHSQIFRVNGTWYSIGDKAVRSGSGAALFGEARYTELYYGVLTAIALFQTFKDSRKNVYLCGSHTPKDIVYRPDLILAAKGQWTVESQGITKKFTVIHGQGIDEPVAAMRHATLSENGTSYRGQQQLRKGELLVIDIGGFTCGFTVASNGIVDYESSQSETTGILDVLEEFESLIRREYAKKLKGTNKLNPLRLRDALLTGKYDAAGLGELDVKKLADEACNVLLRDVMQFYEAYGGAGEYHGILLAGGGGALMEKRLRSHLNHPHVFVAEENRQRMHLATANGGLKVLRLLQGANKL